MKFRNRGTASPDSAVQVQAHLASAPARDMSEAGPDALLPVRVAYPGQSREQGAALQIRTVSPYIAAKRILDIVVSLAALCVFFALLPFLAVAIKLDSPGPVFYTQDRIGINRRRNRAPGYDGRDNRKVLQPGRPFRIYKLRTMRADAEQNGPQWALVNDSRITRSGRILRRTRLDEVPQFINVLRGEMSLIGPRPERLCFIRQLEKEIPNYRDRLLVLPGITGLAQVINGYDDGTESVRRKVDLDRRYIQSSGFRQDARILLSTVKVVLTGDGAH